LPEFKLDAVPFMEALGELSAASKQQDPAHQGVRYLVRNTPETNGDQKITLDLENVPLAEATERLAESAGYRVSARHFAFIFTQKPAVPMLELLPEDVVPSSVMPFVLISNRFEVRWTYTDAGAKKAAAFWEVHDGQPTSLAMGDFVSPTSEQDSRALAPGATNYPQWKADWLKHPTDKIFVDSDVDEHEILLGLTSR
jgi:hypothetical protein